MQNHFGGACRRRCFGTGQEALPRRYSAEGQQLHFDNDDNHAYTYAMTTAHDDDCRRSQPSR